MDQSLLLWLNSFAHRFAWLDFLGIMLAVWGIYVLAGWALVLYFDKKFRKRVYLATVSSIISRLLVVEIIKIVVDRPRPFETLPVHLLITDTGKGQAFSSGHAVILFSIAFSFYKTKWFWPMFALATLSSIARVFVGVHYPSDILASALIAWVIAWSLGRLFKKQFLR
jgi:undecaprenyl-diphosphatase